MCFEKFEFLFNCNSSHDASHAHYSLRRFRFLFMSLKEFELVNPYNNKKKTIDLSTKNQSLYLPKTLVMHPHLLNLNSSVQTFYTFPYCFIHHRVFSLWLQQHISFTLTSSLTPLHQLTKMEALAITDKLKVPVLEFVTSFLGPIDSYTPKISLKLHEYMAHSQNQFHNKHFCHYIKAHEDW